MDLALRKSLKVWGGLALLAVVVAPEANAAGICLTVGSSLYGGGILGTAAAPFEAGCTFGLSTNTGTAGGVVTTSPTSLPSPISQLTSATLNFTDPTGTNNAASANLGTGKLGAYDDGSVTGGSNGPSAAYNDTVHFHISDSASASIVFKVHVDGTESGGGLFDNIFELTSFGVLGFQMDNFGGHPNDFSIFSDPGWGTFTNTSQGGFDYSGTISVTDGESVGITAALSLACVSGEICDFSKTAALSFVLPSDVTFTSDSTVFLTQTSAPAAAPEPASLALMGAGLVALGIFRKKRIHLEKPRSLLRRATRP
jgi:hypothetical protein